MQLLVQSITWVYANTNCKGLIWHVGDFENFNGTQEM